MHEVREGNRVLQFEGELLAKSSSKTRDSYRWVEFELYRTRKGSYVLGRIGQTLLFHDPGCAIVRRNNLKLSAVEDLEQFHVGCSECDPDEMSLEEVCIEKPRHWALIADSPEAVLEALYKYDSSGARYLTLVAQRLIEKASELDTRIDRAYRIEFIA